MGAAKSVLTADFLLCSHNQVPVKNPESQKWDLKPTTPGTDLGICFLFKKDLPTLGVCLVFWPIQRKLFISLPSLASFTRRAPAPQLLKQLLIKICSRASLFFIRTAISQTNPVQCTNERSEVRTEVRTVARKYLLEPSGLLLVSSPV